jgi:hypothetical protein
MPTAIDDLEAGSSVVPDATTEEQDAFLEAEEYARTVALRRVARTAKSYVTRRTASQVADAFGAHDRCAHSSDAKSHQKSEGPRHLVASIR